MGAGTQQHTLTELLASRSWRDLKCINRQVSIKTIYTWNTWPRIPNTVHRTAVCTSLVTMHLVGTHGTYCRLRLGWLWGSIANRVAHRFSAP
jgi:hypothetical protein